MSFNDAFPLTGLDGLDIGPVAKEQSDSTEDNALSCAGLSGNDGESLREVNIQLVYQSVVLYI